MTPIPASPGLPADWQAVLTDRGLGPSAIRNLVEDAYDEADKHAVYPPRSSVFRAFELTKLCEVRAVILGQDPYYAHAGQAHGLAFSVPEMDASVPKSVRVPPALDAIFANLETDRDIPFARPNAGGLPVGDLTNWAKQGVLLLNTSLTVQAGVPASHLARWAPLTSAVIDALCEQPRAIAFTLWGGPAKTYRRDIRTPHRARPMLHPAYRPERGEKHVWRSGLQLPFSEVNEFLTQHNRVPVIWEDL